MNKIILRELVKKSKFGDKKALEQLISEVQNDIYALALRFLWNSEDAKEASQEILVKAITHLSDFREDSEFSTWIYKIASNHLLDIKKSSVEKMKLTQVLFEEDLHTDLSEPSDILRNDPEFSILLEEVRIGCTTAMLNCLDRNHRMTYIIGEILEIESKQAASILNLSENGFRKQLERARSLVQEFLNRVCGVVSPKCKCQCRRRITKAISSGRVSKSNFAFARSLSDHNKTINTIQELHLLKRTVAIYQYGVEFRSPVDFSEKLRSIIESI